MHASGAMCLGLVETCFGDDIQRKADLLLLLLLNVTLSWGSKEKQNMHVLEIEAQCGYFCPFFFGDVGQFNKLSARLKANNLHLPTLDASIKKSVSHALSSAWTESMCH